MPFILEENDLTSLEAITESTQDDFDHKIDNCLYSIIANLYILRVFLCQKLKLGGYSVNENIKNDTVEIWDVFSWIIKPQYS